MIRRLGERRRDLLALTARRSAVAPVIVLAVTATAFALAAISPLDPLAAHLGSAYQFTGSAGREAAHTALGLDTPWWQAWWQWLTGLLAGDAGHSSTYRQPVLEVIAQRLPWTMGLSAVGLALALAVAITAGLTAAYRPGGATDRTLAAMAVVLSAVPTFVSALAAVAVFAVALRWLPVAGAWDTGHQPTIGAVARHLVLPALVLAASQLPWMTLTVRQAVLRAHDSVPVREARARGLSRRTVVTGHIGPVSWTPLIALTGARLPELIVGAVVVEQVFAWPGLAGSARAARAHMPDSLLSAGPPIREINTSERAPNDCSSSSSSPSNNHSARATRASTTSSTIRRDLSVRLTSRTRRSPGCMDRTTWPLVTRPSTSAVICRGEQSR